MAGRTLISPRALFRGSHFVTAVRTCSPFVVRGWEEPTEGNHGSPAHRTASPDEVLADKLDVEIEPWTRHRHEADGRVVPYLAHRLILNGWHKKHPSQLKASRKPGGRHGYNRLYRILEIQTQQAGRDAPGLGFVNDPDPAVETCDPESGRVFYLHSFLARLLGRMVLDVVEPHVEQRLLPTTHAYRPGRSHFSALKQARAYVRRGYHWAATTDIKGFFPSIAYPLTKVVLEDQLPEVGPTLRDLIVWLLFPPVLRRPWHPERRATGARAMVEPRHLLQGGPLAPTVANLVANVMLDQPLLAVRNNVVVVRYSDDALVLGRARQDVEGAVARQADLAARAGFQLHPPDAPVDLRVRPLKWLGKVLHGGTVQTPRDEVERLIGLLATTDTITADFKSRCGQFKTELQLDHQHVRDSAVRHLRARSPLAADALGLVLGTCVVGPVPPGAAVPDAHGDVLDIAATEQAARTSAPLSAANTSSQAAGGRG